MTTLDRFIRWTLVVVCVICLIIIPIFTPHNPEAAEFELCRLLVLANFLLALWKMRSIYTCLELLLLWAASSYYRSLDFIIYWTLKMLISLFFFCLFANVNDPVLFYFLGFKTEPTHASVVIGGKEYHYRMTQDPSDPSKDNSRPPLNASAHKFLSVSSLSFARWEVWILFVAYLVLLVFRNKIGMDIIHALLDVGVMVITLLDSFNIDPKKLRQQQGAKAKRGQSDRGGVNIRDLSEFVLLVVCYVLWKSKADQFVGNMFPGVLFILFIICTFLVSAFLRLMLKASQEIK